MHCKFGGRVASLIFFGILLVCSFRGTNAQTAKSVSAVEQPIADLVRQAMQEGEMPGCVIAFGNHHEIQFLQAYGQRQVQDVIRPMKIDTVFDLASLTKPVATATAILLLAEQDRLALDKSISHYMPAFARHGKDQITLELALIHQSGLIPDNPMSDYADGPEVAWQRIMNLKPTKPVGEVFQYSDVNFLVLGRLVEVISGQTLDQFTRENIFQPLQMHDTGFRPTAPLLPRAAATGQRGGKWLVGEVHDPRAHALGGVAGHAGLFSTAPDLARYCQAILTTFHESEKPTEARFVLKRETLQTMTQAYTVSRGTRGLGWDKRSPYGANRGQELSDSAFGHGGFTGTVLWVDPKRDFFFIFLSSRLHPDGKGSVNRLAAQIQDVILAQPLIPTRE